MSALWWLLLAPWLQGDDEPDEDEPEAVWHLLVMVAMALATAAFLVWQASVWHRLGAPLQVPLGQLLAALVALAGVVALLLDVRARLRDRRDGAR